MKYNKLFSSNLIKKTLISSVLTLSCFLLPVNTCLSFADQYTDAMEANKLLPVQTNEIEGWPPGPAISAYSAILMDADTGVILYEKNSHEKMYPASTTKLLTTLIAMEDEKSNLNDMVDFSYDAVMSIPRDGSNMGMDAGEKMTLEECLYGVLVVSANEVANAIAEYVSGDINTFVDLMNKRAKELGCVDSHFNNPHGYSDPDHYTSAYDLAMIGREFFDNELLSRISRTPTYHWYATEYQPDDIVLGSTNYFMKGRKYCEGLVGSKTGFTDESRQCLVTACQRNGIKLICVVMSEETPYQYDDTLTLFNYGFSNFELLKVSDYETRYTITKDSFFHSDSDVFGNSDDFLVLDDVSKIIVPTTITFDELTSSINYSDSKENVLATVDYSYHNVYLGSASILFVTDEDDIFTFDENYIESEDNIPEEEPTFIYINHIIYGLISIVVIFIVVTFIHKILSNYHFGSRSSSFGFKKRKKRHTSKYTVDKKRMKERKPSRSSSYIDFK